MVSCPRSRQLKRWLGWDRETGFTKYEPRGVVSSSSNQIRCCPCSGQLKRWLGPGQHLVKVRKARIGLGLGSQKTSPSRDWNADLTVEDGLFPTSSIWNSPSSTVRSAFQSLDASVSEMRRPKLSVLPLLRAIEEVAWAGAASSETTMITAQKQQSTALRTSIRHPSRMGVDGDADDERSPPPLRRTSGDSSSPSLRERYMEKDQGGLGINLSEVGSFKDDGRHHHGTHQRPSHRERRAPGLRYMDNKMDRATKSDGKFQIQLDNIRESVDAIGVAFVQFGMDDEKVQLIADKVIDALYPIITKGHEQNKADTERR
ncbi:hypothetical protein D6D29_09072 [Aureobasidium pullulans]|nr:hypothetical protein D6D29_09072 [Aureobasidium pullulans]